MLPALGITGCNAQEQKKAIAAVAESKTEDTPKVQTRVVKRHNENGHLIGYDYSATWSYSGKNGQLQQTGTDSVISQFKRSFDGNFAMLSGNDFGATTGASLFL